MSATQRTPQDKLADAIRDALVMTKDDSAKAIYQAADAMSAQEYRAVITDAIRSVYRAPVVDAWDSEDNVADPFPAGEKS